MKKFLIAICITLLHFATTGAQEVSLDFTTNDWGISSTNTTSSKTYSNGAYNIKLSGGYKYGSSNSTKYLYLNSGASLTLPTFDFDVEKIEVVGNKGSSQKTTMNFYVGSKAVSTEAVGCQDSDGNAKTNSFEINEDYQASGNIYTLKISVYNAQITKIYIYAKEGSAKATATTTSFGSDIDGQTFTVYGNNTFEGKTATVTPASAEGTLTYSSSDTDVATVDASTGAITIGETYGSTTITAQFTPTDATAYKASSACYVIVRKEAEPSYNTKTVTFDPKTENSTTWKMKKDGVTVSVPTINDGNFNIDSKTYYSIYTGRSVTFSTEEGNITSIVITWLSGSSVTSNHKGLTGDGFSSNDTKGIWTGNASSVTLTNSGSLAALIATITVTVSTIEGFTLTDALESEETLFDNLGKTMNVTVGRTMNTGSGYYTLCLPFDVPTEKMTALKGASVLQYDGRDDTTLKFVSAESITAGRAYLVLPKEKIENPVFEEVTISATQPLSTDDDYDFVGTLTKTSLATDGTNLFVGANNVLTIPTADDYIIGGLRAYFRVPLGTNEAKLSLLVDDQQASIPLIPISPNSSSAVYTVGGVNLGRSVPRGRGIYIIGGKKTLKLEN